jgi:hypothetical protein
MSASLPVSLLSTDIAGRLAGTPAELTGLQTTQAEEQILHAMLATEVDYVRICRRNPPSQSLVVEEVLWGNPLPALTKLKTPSVNNRQRPTQMPTTLFNPLTRLGTHLHRAP